VSGLRNKPKEQPKECGCACNGLVLEMLQGMTAQSKLMTEQNKLMAQIVDQNNQLLAQLESDDSEEPKSKHEYLDG
jgi:hypothetical protein